MATVKDQVKEQVLDTYSKQADTYDERGNVDSCWGKDTQRIIDSIEIKPEYKTVLDVGCGTGVALIQLAAKAPHAQFIGVEPADNMRQRAIEATKHLPNVKVLGGSFEDIPVEASSADYMFSINAFHWSADIHKALEEVTRVMKPTGEMDHFFIGRDIGREFILKTTPVFMKYLGPKRLLEAATMRHNFTKDQAEKLFVDTFGANHSVSLDERYDTYYDTVEGHLGWWVRIEPQLLGIAPEVREACYRDIRAALGTLDEGKGVPYTKHTLHASVRPA